MTRDEFYEMALKVAVAKMDQDARKRNAWSPILLALRSIVDGNMSESDIALVKFCYQHPENNT